MKTSIAFLICLFSISAFSQPEIPEKYSLSNEGEYANQEELVEDCMKWLLKEPLHKNMEKRSEINAFVMIWLSGSPTIDLEIKSSAMPFLETDEELFFTFVHGMALYKMSHPKEEDEVVLHAAGLNAVAKQILQSEDHIKRTKEIKRILKAYKKGNTNQYVQELMEGKK